MRKWEGNIKGKLWLEPPWAVAFLVLVALVLLQCLVDLSPALWLALRFDRAAFASGAWWQVLTAQGVHFGWMHALFNGLGFALLIVVFYGWVAVPMQWIALLGGLVGVAFAVVLDPQCAVYAGASGALHGYWAGGALALCLHSVRQRNQSVTPYLPGLLGLLMLAALALKLVWQHVGGDRGAVAALGLPDGVAVYASAHYFGAIGGAAAALGVVLLRALVQRGGAVPAQTHSAEAEYEQQG
ncbi:rhomboid family intramembrane serine protease [Rhodoferax aquaticus]|nr:rhomboid family intramembrane serine protease [Rhodoferax aquaticus]